MSSGNWKDRKRKNWILRDSLGTEENNLSIRKLRALETKPSSAVTSSIFNCFEVFLTESMDIEHIWIAQRQLIKHMDKLTLLSAKQKGCMPVHCGLGRFFHDFSRICTITRKLSVQLLTAFLMLRR